jgi:hypothetical protein
LHRADQRLPPLISTVRESRCPPGRLPPIPPLGRRCDAGYPLVGCGSGEPHGRQPEHGVACLRYRGQPDTKAVISIARSSESMRGRPLDARTQA